METFSFFTCLYLASAIFRFYHLSASYSLNYRVIGQKELVKTAVVVENSTATAVISFLKEDIGWTKRVGKIA